MQPKSNKQFSNKHKQFSSGFVHCHQRSNEIRHITKYYLDLSIVKEMFFEHTAINLTYISFL